MLNFCSCCLSLPNRLTLPLPHLPGCVRRRGGLMARAIVLAVLLMYLTVWDQHLQLDVGLIKFAPYLDYAPLQLLKFLSRPFAPRRSLFEDLRICLASLGVQSTSSSEVKVSAASARETLNGVAPRCPLDILEKVDLFVRRVFCRQFQPAAVVMDFSSAYFRLPACVLIQSY